MSDAVFYILVFLIIVLLAGLALWIARQTTGFQAGNILPKKAKKRLALVETKFLDSRHRLVLVRRDNVEHLIMTGGPVDVVIETGIPAQPVLATGASDPYPHGDSERHGEFEISPARTQNGSLSSETLTSRLDTGSAG